MLYPDGHVQPCCYNGRDLGNVNETGFSEIWNGREYRRLREHLLRGEYDAAGCGDCPLYSRSGWTTREATASRLEFAAGSPAQLANARRALESMKAGETRLESNPVALALELSQACNFDCTFCFQHDKLLGIRGDRIRTLIAEYVPTARELIMTGGDPFAYKENIRILEALDDEAAKHVALEFYTNGALLDRHWELLERFDNIFMVVSLHSLVDQTYRRIMRSPDPVERVVRNIDRFVARAREKPGWRLSLTNIVMKSTVGEIDALAEFAVARGAAVNFVHMHGDYDENIYDKPELIEDRDGLYREIDRAIARLVAAGTFYQTGVNNLEFIRAKLAA